MRQDETWEIAIAGLAVVVVGFLLWRQHASPAAVATATGSPVQPTPQGVAAPASPTFSLGSGGPSQPFNLTLDTLTLPPTPAPPPPNTTPTNNSTGTPQCGCSGALSGVDALNATMAAIYANAVSAIENMPSPSYTPNINIQDINVSKPSVAAMGILRGPDVVNSDYTPNALTSQGYTEILNPNGTLTYIPNE